MCRQELPPVTVLFEEASDWTLLFYLCRMWRVCSIVHYVDQLVKHSSFNDQLQSSPLSRPSLSESLMLLHKLHLFSQDGDSVWLIPGPPKNPQLSLLLCLNSRWEDCSHTVPQTGWPVPWTQPLVHHWYTQHLQSHQSISGDVRTLSCTVWGVQSEENLWGWSPSQTQDPSVSLTVVCLSGSQ